MVLCHRSQRVRSCVGPRFLTSDGGEPSIWVLAQSLAYGWRATQHKGWATDRPPCTVKNPLVTSTSPNVTADSPMWTHHVHGQLARITNVICITCRVLTTVSWRMENSVDEIMRKYIFSTDCIYRKNAPINSPVLSKWVKEHPVLSFPPP